MTDDDRRRAAIDAVERQILSVGRGVATLSADKLDQLRAMLDVHAGELRWARSGSLDARSAGARSARAVAEHLGAYACPLCLSRFGALLPISDEVEGAARRPGEATATDYAETIAAIFQWEAGIAQESRLRAAIQKRMAGVVRTCRSRIEQRMQVGADDDIPDVRLLARDILRIEAVEWAVELAGGVGQAEPLRQLAHHAARKAVQWAGKVFERFKAGPTEFSHFDAVATLSAVDDLLVVILRVLESDRDARRAGSHPFVLTLGEQALQDFVNGLQHMTNRYLDIAEQHLTSGGAAGSFVLSVLQVLQRILRLGHALAPSVDMMEIRLNHESALVRMVAMRAKLKSSLQMPGASRDYETRLAVLETALADVGA